MYWQVKSIPFACGEDKVIIVCIFDYLKIATLDMNRIANRQLVRRELVPLALGIVPVRLEMVKVKSNSFWNSICPSHRAS